MKATVLSVAALSLLQAVCAQPHRRHAHQLDRHVKKDVVTVVETYIAEATAAPEVIVFVDQDGNAVSTTTDGLPTNIYKAAAPATPSPDPSPVIDQKQQVASSKSASAVATSSPSSSPAAQPASGASGFGMSYSPYNRDGTCKTATQVLSDVSSLGGYSLIRTHGTDCDTVSNVYAACKATGKKLFAGIFTIAAVPAEVATIVTAVKGDWSAMYAINIGNELVDQGQASASDVMAAVDTARGLLRAAGFTGPVSTVDTLAATIRPGNSILCDRSDICTVNAHPFFDSTATASNAGKWLSDNISTLKSKLANPSQKIIIAETGWPTQGSANGAAVPSPENQNSAISSIKSTFSSDIILLSAFNRQWLKGNTGAFGQEYWFGIFGDCPSG